MSTVTFNPNGCKTHPNIAVVEGFLGGVGRLVFPDGTVQFAENENYPDVVYSPRMKEDELEVFCESNLSKYEAYFEANFEAIEKGDELPRINVFWSTVYKICHRYDIGDRGVFISAVKDPTDAAIYVQFKAETLYCEEVSISNDAIADALIMLYGCTKSDQVDDFIEIDCYSEREVRCGQWYSDNFETKTELFKSDEAINTILEPHVKEQL